MYCIVSCCVILYCVMVLYCVILYCVVLYCTVLCCIEKEKLLDYWLRVNLETVKISPCFNSGNCFVLDHCLIGTTWLSMETDSFHLFGFFGVCVYMHVYIFCKYGGTPYVGVHRCACGSPRLMDCPQWLSHLVNWSGISPMCLVLLGTCSEDVLSPPHKAGITSGQPHLCSIYVSSGDPDTDPYTGVANALTTEPLSPST